MLNIHELIRHLNHGQRQGDGTTMLVGRHAVTEAIRLLNLLGETNDALAACQSQASGILRSIRGDIEAAYNGLDYLTSVHVATAADPNGGRQLAIDAAEIKGRLLQHMKQIDSVLRNSTTTDRPHKGIYARSCPSGEPHIPYCDDPTQCMACGATITLKHAPECSYWDGLMAQVCNCGASSHGPPECRHSSVKIIKQGESARCLDCGNVISLELRATATVKLAP